MQTFKTAVVVIVLLALLYGVYVVLSRPDARDAASQLARELVNSGSATSRSPGDDGPWTPASSDTGSPAPPEAWAGLADTGLADAGLADPWAAPAGPAARPRSASHGEPGDSSAVPHAQHGLSNPNREMPNRADYGQQPGPSVGQRSADADRQSGSSSPAPDPDVGPVGFSGGDSFERSEMSDRERGREVPPQSRSADSFVGSERTQEANGQGAGPATPPAGSLSGPAFQRTMQTAQNQIRGGEFRAALESLSMFYGSPDLTPDQHAQLLDLLDPLAGKVIYSTEHHLESAYEVRRDETLEQIADRFQVPWQLLANINGIRNPKVMAPGTSLKIVPGPFRAEVDMPRGELTLFLGRLYAGRFPVTFGADPPPQAGNFEVREKRNERAYFAGDGRTLAPDDPRNPYGDVWLDLGRNLCLHGSPRDRFPGSERLGCISLSPRDARDVFGILSEGSEVVVRR